MYSSVKLTRLAHEAGSVPEMLHVTSLQAEHEVQQSCCWALCHAFMQSVQQSVLHCQVPVVSKLEKLERTKASICAPGGERACDFAPGKVQVLQPGQGSIIAPLWPDIADVSVAVQSQAEATACLGMHIYCRVQDRSCRLPQADCISVRVLQQEMHAARGLVRRHGQECLKSSPAGSVPVI